MLHRTNSINFMWYPARAYPVTLTALLAVSFSDDCTIQPPALGTLAIAFASLAANLPGYAARIQIL